MNESIHNVRHGRGRCIEFDTLCEMLRKAGLIDCPTWDLDVVTVLAIDELAEEIHQRFGEDT